MGSHDSGEEFGQPGASFGAQVLQEFHMDVVVTWGFVFCTSSVNAMLTRLKSEPLASRWRAARLLMFYKIHYGLVATPMLLDIKLHPVPTWLENSLAYHIPPSSCDYHLYSFFPALFVTGTFFLKRLSGPLPLRYSGYDSRIIQSVFR